MAAACCGSLATPGLAHAANRRGARTLAGVRATLSTYDTAVLAGNGATACPLMTAAAQKQLAKTDDRPTCQAAIKLAGELFKAEPKVAARFRSYAKTVKITLHGSAATVPNWNTGGQSTFVYTHGLWYITT